MSVYRSELQAPTVELGPGAWQAPRRSDRHPALALMSGRAALLSVTCRPWDNRSFIPGVRTETTRCDDFY